MASERTIVERHFPEEIIHGIQSFLPGKDAARTCLSSKSWHNAWFTRPILSFDQRDFKKPWKSTMPPKFSDEFSNFVEKSIRRYQYLGLKIEGLVLRMDDTTDERNSALVNEIVTWALELSANELDLTFVDVDYAIPSHVFATNTLTKLSLECCTVDPLVLLCCRLESLNLRNVCINEDTIQDILRGCPSIKKLDLCSCGGIMKLDVSNMINLVKFHYHEANFSFVEFESRLDPHVQFCNLRVLSLGDVNVSDNFFSDFSSRFPFIQKLTLEHYFGYRDIRISSKSLKYLTLKQGWDFKRAQLDVPNACVVQFKGYYGNNWNMDLSRRQRELESSSFIEMNCLMDVSRSGFRLELMISI